MLACGPGALLSHRDAAALWGLIDFALDRVDVTVAGSAREGPRGIRRHGARSLTDSDRAYHDGIPVTSVARTLLDLAAILPAKLVQRAYEESAGGDLLDIAELRDLLARSKGKKGVQALRRICEIDPDFAARLRSELERMFRDLIVGSDIPMYQPNYVLDGYEVDAYWPEARLVVELTAAPSTPAHLQPSATTRRPRSSSWRATRCSGSPTRWSIAERSGCSTQFGQCEPGASPRTRRPAPQVYKCRMAELPEGTVFAGHRIDGIAGRGGMGVVYRATHLALDHVVALKVIAAELAGDPRFRERFVRESRTAVSIRHPNVVQVRHAGEEDGVLFVTMDYIEGSDLRALISAQRRIEPDRAAAIIGQVAQALDAAHERGLVHRDVKPGNVLIEGRDGEEHVYLTDFGLTKRMSGATELTASGAFIGTLEYMAPEQIRGGELDARTDVYALGGVAFATITGQPPFGRVEGDVAKLYAHLNDPPPRASDRVPGLPPAIDAVLQRAMAKKPDERYDSAREFARALEAAAAGSAEQSTVTAPVVVEPTEEATPPEEPPTEPTAPTRVGPPEGRRRALGLLAGLAVVAAAVGAIALLGGGEEEPAANEPSAAVGEPIDMGDDPLGVAAKEGLVLVADRENGELAVVDESERTPLDPETVGSDPEAVFAGDPIVWVTNSGDGTISRFEFAGGGLVPNEAKPTIPIEGSPQDVAVADQAAWVTSSNGTVTRIDPSTGTVGAVFPVGKDPYGVAVEPLPGDPDLVFIVNRGENTVSVIDRLEIGDVNAGEIAKRAIPVGDRPKAVVVDQGIAWVTNTDGDSVSRIRRPGPRSRNPRWETSATNPVTSPLASTRSGSAAPREPLRASTRKLPRLSGASSSATSRRTRGHRRRQRCHLGRHGRRGHRGADHSDGGIGSPADEPEAWPQPRVLGDRSPGRRGRRDRPGRRGGRIRLGLGRGVLRLGRGLDPGLARAADDDDQARRRDHAGSSATSGGGGDGRRDDRRPLRRSLHVRLRAVRPPGLRGLVRRGLREAVGPDPGVHRGRSRRSSPARARSSTGASTTSCRWRTGAPARARR